MRQTTVGEVLHWLDEVAPFETAEAYDNVGLLVGDAAAPAAKVLFCVDATLDVVQEAVRQGVQLIVAHHPLMFGGIRRIDYNLPEGRVLQALLSARLHLVVVHTNLDKAPGGTGDSLAQALGLQGVESAGEFLRVGHLPAPLTGEALQALVEERLQAQVRCYGQAAGPITSVAVGPGAAGDGAPLAAQRGVQAYVVGEIKHHEILLATGLGLLVLEAGHHATEAVGMKALYERFQTMAASEGLDNAPLWFSKAPFAGALSAR